MDYLEGHNKSGIKVGDKVKVLYIAQSFVGGWQNSWEKEMNDYVGKTFIISEDRNVCGFAIMKNERRLCFPYFVLDKIEDVKVKTNMYSSCPQCNGELVEKYSDWAGGNINKCKSCGWC